MSNSVQNPVVYVDYREETSNVASVLEKDYGVSVLRQYLKSGDFIIDGQVAVERKTSQDFIQSLVDGRLFRQMIGMKKLFPHCVLIIEGEDLYNAGRNIHAPAVRGAVVSLALFWHVPVLWARDANETASLLYIMGRQNRSVLKKELSCRNGPRPKRLDRRRLYILQGLPGVGPKLAGRLLDHYGSIEKIFASAIDELTKVSGVGSKKAAAIRKILE